MLTAPQSDWIITSLLFQASRATFCSSHSLPQAGIPLMALSASRPRRGFSEPRTHRSRGSSSQNLRQESSGVRTRAHEAEGSRLSRGAEGRQEMLVQRALRDLAVKRHPPHLLPIVGGFGAGVGGEVFGYRADLDVLGLRVALEAADPDTCDLRREVGAFAVPFLTTAPSRLREVWGSAAGGRVRGEQAGS